MKILVTGREGQVARAIGERFAGHELIFVGRPELDLAKADSVERTIAAVAPDLVFSIAAYTGVDKAEDEPELARSVNADGPAALARAAAEIGAPVIHLSTDYVFDGASDRPWLEEDDVAPLGTYGLTKFLGEQAVASSGASYAIVRTSWVYSPFGSNFVRTMLQLAATRDVVRVVGDQRGAPTSAFDIADGLQAIVRKWSRSGTSGTSGNEGVFHLAGSGIASWAEFARAIFADSRAMGGPWAEVISIPTTAYPTRAKRPAYSVLDCSRFASSFDYRAPQWRESLGPVVARLVGGPE